jgi:hypothetical protein
MVVGVSVGVTQHGEIGWQAAAVTNLASMCLACARGQNSASFVEEGPV